MQVYYMQFIALVSRPSLLHVIVHVFKSSNVSLLRTINIHTIFMRIGEGLGTEAMQFMYFYTLVSVPVSYGGHWLL